mgnify:CR=1 FL=1
MSIQRWAWIIVCWQSCSFCNANFGAVWQFRRTAATAGWVTGMSQTGRWLFGNLTLFSIHWVFTSKRHWKRATGMHTERLIESQQLDWEAGKSLHCIHWNSARKQWKWLKNKIGICHQKHSYVISPYMWAVLSVNAACSETEQSSLGHSAGRYWSATSALTHYATYLLPA